MKVLIIGGVAGGASAAARLRRLDENAQIILFERGDYISYANCGLPYYVGGEIREKSALTLQTPESFQARFQVEVRVHNEVLSIDRIQKKVKVRDLQDNREYEESYDKLILSPGARPVIPPIPGIQHPRIMTLRDVPDALSLRNFLERESPKTAVVVGGGYIGTEMAENLTQAGVSCTIVELGEQLLAPLDREMASIVQNYLRGKGIDIRLGEGVASFEELPQGIRVKTDKSSIDTDMVLLSIGVQPDSHLAADAGLTMGMRGSIAVDDRMRTSDPDIYAVGDAVEIVNFVTGQKGLIPLAGPANKQGRIAADNICGHASTYTGTQGSSVVKLFDLTVASTGLNEKAARAAGISCDSVHLFPASHASYYPGSRLLGLKVTFEKGSGKILGAQLVGEEGADKRCDVLATCIRAGFTAFDLTELELCYAPPYSSAKDPVNMAGYMIENLLTGKVRQFQWDQVPLLPRDGSVTLIDVRTPAEYQRGHIDGFIHLPLDSLRDHLSQLDPQKEVYVHCQTGLRSYIACRILQQHGFSCYNLSGGYHLYQQVLEGGGYCGAGPYPCGMERKE